MTGPGDLNLEELSDANHRPVSHDRPQPPRRRSRSSGLRSITRSHAEGAAQIEAMLEVPPHLLRNGEGWAVEEFTRLATHSVTHVDAPWHYNSMIQGQPGRHDRRAAAGVVLLRRRGPRHDRQGRRREDRCAGRGGRPGDNRLHRSSRSTSCCMQDRPGRLLWSAGLCLAGLCRDPRGDPLALRPGRAGHGNRRLGLGRPTRPPGQGGDLPGRSRGSSGRPTSATCRTRRSSGWSTSARCRRPGSRWPASR